MAVTKPENHDNGAEQADIVAEARALVDALGPREGLGEAVQDGAAIAAIVESLGLPMREVTWELEPDVFEEIGVEAVPLTAVVDEAGSVEWLAASVPRKGSLQRAAARAGVID